MRMLATKTQNSKLILRFVTFLGVSQRSQKANNTRQNNNKNLCQQCQKRRGEYEDDKNAANKQKETYVENYTTCTVCFMPLGYRLQKDIAEI